MWPKPLPNHWVYGNVIGVGVDTKDHVYIIHRGAGSLEPKEICAAANPPLVRVLRAGAAGGRVRRRRQLRARVGRSGPGLRVARVEPRHHARHQGQRVHRRQRRPGRPHPEVHAGRQVRQAVRLRLRQRRQQRHVRVQQGREDLARRKGERGLRRRRLRQQPRRGDRHGHRQDQALLGRLRQQAGRHATSAPTTRARRSRSSSATRCTAPSRPTTAWSTSAIARTTASRCSRRTASS